MKTRLLLKLLQNGVSELTDLFQRTERLNLHKKFDNKGKASLRRVSFNRSFFVVFTITLLHAHDFTVWSMESKLSLQHTESKQNPKHTSECSKLG